MDKPKTTHLTLREDWPTAQSAIINGHNLNACGFNIDYIAPRDPLLAMEVMKLYDRALQLKDRLPMPSDYEDFALALEEVRKLWLTSH